MMYLSHLIAIIGLVSAASLSGTTSTRAQNNASEIGRQEWIVRVNVARERAELARQKHRSFVPQLPTLDEIAKDSSTRVLEDHSLQPGDVVSTEHGLFRYQGNPNREHKPDDFVRIR